MEIWKKVIGYDYEYEISSLGNFRCMNPFHKSNYGVNYKQSKDVKGYLRVGLVLNGKTKNIKTHRLVAKYFLKDYEDKLTVNHIDFIKTNNNVSNLEMMTMAENILHYQCGVISKKSSSKYVGIGYHSGINKWTSRVTFKNKRYSLGTYDTENEAIKAYEEFNKNPSKFKIGKGISNIGKSKYSKEDNERAIELSYKIGIRKAGIETGMGSTRISTLRKKLCNLKN